MASTNGGGGGKNIGNTKAATKPKGPAQSTTAPKTAVMDPINRGNFTVTDSVGTSLPTGGYQGSYGGGTGGVPASPLDSLSAAPQNDDDWLAGDSSYQAQLAALQRALADSEADYTAQSTKYDTDYNDSLKNLGWLKAMQDDPATADVDETTPGGWNFQDQNTSAGRAFSGQQNDFASRGLLQSSLYGTAQDNLTRSLNDQLGSVNTGRQTFMDDVTRQRASGQNQNQLSQQQARAEALARRATGISLV